MGVTPVFESSHRTWQPEELRDAWLLDPRINFLNHGSYGARLRSVLAAQDDLRRAVEANPVRLMERERDARITASRRAVADFVGAQLSDLAFVVNATDAANAVVRSLELAPGDELLTTSHVYNGVRQTLAEAARRSGASYREIPLPVPIPDAESIAGRVVEGFGPRTRLLLIDHVSSPSALVFPIEEILVAARERGVLVFVDGAHAPGQLELDLDRLGELGASYYTGNLHKWPCAPLGSAFLWIHPDHQTGIRPTVVSHFRGQAFTEEFRWQATRDLSAWMLAGQALAELEKLVPGGWPAIRGHNRDLARWARALVEARLAERGVVPVAGSEELVGSMVSFLLPAGVQERFERPAVLHDHFEDVHGIEVPINALPEAWTVRLSAHLHCHEDQFVAFADALETILDG